MEETNLQKKSMYQKVVAGMNKIFVNDYATMILRILLGVVFIMAAMSKIPAPDEFMATVRQYNVLPDPLETWYGYALPWVELIFGFAVVIGLFTRFSVTIINLMLFSFMIAILITLYRGGLIACGCFNSESALDWSTYVRDLLFMVMAGLVTLSHKNRFSLDKWIRSK
ncbi:MAG: MauE/DoxX family redox-associated membrane protein [Patescibacteria group bacterium]